MDSGITHHFILHAHNSQGKGLWGLLLTEICVPVPLDSVSTRQWLLKGLFVSHWSHVTVLIQ